MPLSKQNSSTGAAFGAKMAGKARQMAFCTFLPHAGCCLDSVVFSPVDALTLHRERRKLHWWRVVFVLRNIVRPLLSTARISS